MMAKLSKTLDMMFAWNLDAHVMGNPPLSCFLSIWLLTPIILIVYGPHCYEPVIS